MSEGPGGTPAPSQTVSRFRELVVRAGQGACDRTGMAARVAADRGRPRLPRQSPGSGLGSISAPTARMVGVGLFVLLLAASFWPLVRLAAAPRARRFWDGSTGIPGSGTRPPTRSSTRWRSAPPIPARARSGRSTAAAPRMRSATCGWRRPRPDMPRRDRYALRAVAVLALVASAFVAGPEMGPRLTAAFDWRSPPRRVRPSGSTAGSTRRSILARRPVMIDLAKSQTLRAPDPFDGRDPHRRRGHGRDHGRRRSRAPPARSKARGRICARSASRSKATPRSPSRRALPARPA